MACSYQTQPSASTPILTVIGRQYCSPYQLEFAVVRKVMTMSDGNFTVTDVNKNTVFKVKGSFFTLHDHRVLFDAAGYPITTLRSKIATMHDRWKAYRGESTDAEDLIFNFKRSSRNSFETKFYVFLAKNTEEDVCDFKVEGSLEESCIVYAGESNNIVAQIHKKDTVRSILLGKDHFMVTVYPNVDYAFIVALIAILAPNNEIPLVKMLNVAGAVAGSN